MKKYQTGGSTYVKPIIPQTLAINVEDQHEIEKFNQDRKRINRPTSNTPVSSGTIKQKSKNKIYELQSGGMSDVYTQGYQDNSKYRFLPSITIPGGNISMNNVSVPIKAELDNGQTHIMQPNQNYFFPNTKYVRETKMQTGGQPQQPQGDPIQEMLMAYFQMNQMSEEQIQAFMTEFQGMSPEEQQQVLQYIQQEMGGQEQPEMPSQEMQEPPQQQMQEQPMQTGGMYLREPDYYQSGGFLIPMQTGSYVPPSGYQTIRANPVQMQLSDGSTMKADNVDYTTKPNPLAVKRKELKQAERVYEKGQSVRQVQELLVKEGYDIGKRKDGSPLVDGLLGNKTAAALAKYEAEHPTLNLDGWKETFTHLSGNPVVAKQVTKEAPVEENKVASIVAKTAPTTSAGVFDVSQYGTVDTVLTSLDTYNGKFKLPNSVEDDTPVNIWSTNFRSNYDKNRYDRKQSTITDATKHLQPVMKLPSGEDIFIDSKLNTLVKRRTDGTYTIPKAYEVEYVNKNRK